MKIGRTNAIAISGGTTKPPYEEWQEGFCANWDSVIQNAPQAGVYPVLHIYNKVNSIRHISTFPDTVTIVTYNPTTGIYRPITLDANKNLFFEESDYFINDYDGLNYVCVIYKTHVSWGGYYFNTTLPVVYSNTKFCTGESTGNYIDLITNSNSYPFLRGVDSYNPSWLRISAWLEHLTAVVYPSSINIYNIDGSDTQVRLLKEFVENAPANTNFTLRILNLQQPTISDDKLADWFYNDFFYNYYNGTTYGPSASFTMKNVRKFKINTNLLLTGDSYLFLIPNCIYLDGTFTENQLNNATSAGIHNGFRSLDYKLLQNFPMWTVLDGATTGCLLPMTTTNTNNYTYGSFLFYSKNLESRYFCEFDENGIIEDPTKYFICNLPVEINTHANIYVRFMDLTFKDNYTASQQDAIRTYLANKKWNLVW